MWLRLALEQCCRTELIPEGINSLKSSSAQVSPQTNYIVRCGAGGGDGVSEGPRVIPVSVRFGDISVKHFFSASIHSCQSWLSRPTGDPSKYTDGYAHGTLIYLIWEGP